MRKISVFLTMVLLVLALVGCGMNKKDDMKDNAANDSPVEDSVNEKNDPVGDDEDDMNNDRTGENGEGHMEVAKEAADKVTELDEVESANVILTDTTAYVAVMMNKDADIEEGEGDTSGMLPKELEDKVAAKVREAHQNVDQVYVSLNPEFVDRMKDYGKKIDEGEPIEGLFEEFGEAMRNVFPNAR